MLETMIALLLAHALADFVFQTRQMVANKAKMRVLLGHILIVGLTSAALLGQLHWPVLGLIVASHLAMDAIKIHAMNDRLGAFVTDQAVHLGFIIIAALIWPHTYGTGIWAAPPALLAGFIPAGWFQAMPGVMVVMAGAILAVRGGSFLIGKVMDPLKPHAESDLNTGTGLPDGGALIGVLERSLVFVLVLGGQFSAIGFLVAAKSILRFNPDQGQRAMTEYVIIGTLLSFGWAILVALATTYLYRQTAGA